MGRKTRFLRSVHGGLLSVIQYSLPFPGARGQCYSAGMSNTQLGPCNEQCWNRWMPSHCWLLPGLLTPLQKAQAWVSRMFASHVALALCTSGCLSQPRTSGHCTASCEDGYRHLCQSQYAMSIFVVLRCVLARSNLSFFVLLCVANFLHSCNTLGAP